MRENAFSSIIRKDLANFCKHYEIPIHLNLIVDAPRSKKKPYDFYMVAKKFIAIELKVEGGLSIRKDKVVPHQIYNLTEVVKTGHSSAYIIVLFEREKKVAIVSPEKWIEIFSNIIKKSIKVNKFLERAEFLDCYIIDRVKMPFGTAWDWRTFWHELA